MTLIVGALFPWGDLLESPLFKAAAQLGIPRSAILAADSRWTYESGKTVDGAVKLFGIGEPCIAAYAGGAAAGEDAIAALSAGLGRTRTVDEFAIMIGGILREAWRAHAHKDDDLDILFGVSTKDRGAWLGHFSASDSFTPHTVEDMRIIAPTVATQHFRKLLQDGAREVLDNASKRAVELNVESWATRLAATVRMTCESGVHAAVGGDILCGHTTLGKAQGQGIIRVNFESGHPRAEEIDLHPLEARMVRKHWRHGSPDGSC